MCVAVMITTACASGVQQAGDEPAGSATATSSEEINDLSVEASDSRSADQQAVDVVFDNFIAGSVILSQLQGDSLEEILTQYEVAQSSWTQAADALRAGIPGVPAETSQAVLQVLDRTLLSLTSLVACFRSTTTTDCNAETITAGDDANALGREVVALIPYGSRSNDEILSALEGAESPAVTSTEVESVSQSNARKKAQSYLDYTAFSRQGLIEQLEYEGFSTADATYGSDAVGADWNEQAVKKAESYLEYSSFSRSGLIEQLEYEGFTTSQATYGVNGVGL